MMLMPSAVLEDYIVSYRITTIGGGLNLAWIYCGGL